MEIILIRHGKPKTNENSLLSASEYTNWIRKYNRSEVDDNSRPLNTNLNNKRSFIVSSDLTRTIHSANIYTNQAPDLISKCFKEIEIPRYKIPFRFKAMTWVYLCRVLWVLGIKGSFESYSQAKVRSETASNYLVSLAKEKETVILFGHGYINLHIRKLLIKKGWVLQSKSNDFWGVTSLTYNTQ